MDDNASANGDGASWASAHKYLQDALASAEYGDEIWVAEGTYKPDQGAGKTPGDRASPFILVNGVGMYGGFLGTESSRDPQGDNNQTILSGEIDENSSLWSLNVVSGANLDANTTFDGFRITKGNANGQNDSVYSKGGGFYLYESDLILLNLIFANNSAATNGGAVLVESSIKFSNCLFSSNSAGGRGGAIFCSKELIIENCEFIYNSAGKGGAVTSKSVTSKNCKFVFNSSSNGAVICKLPGSSQLNEFSFINCVMSNNSSSEDGGVLYMVSSSPTLRLTLIDCLLLKNSAGRNGGVLFCDSSFSSPQITLKNCEIRNNSAASGGGIYSSSDTYYKSKGNAVLNLSECLFIENSSNKIGHREGGGGIYIEAGTLNLTNCIFYENSAHVGGGIYHSFGNYKNGEMSADKFVNSIFMNNESGAIYLDGSDEIELYNCLLIKNSSNGYGGAISGSPSICINSIFWMNSSYTNELYGTKTIGHGTGTSFVSIIQHEAVEAKFPGDPSARERIYIPNLNILHNWEGDARGFNADPLFVNVADPDGPDNLWFTADDGLLLKENSPAINAGHNASLQADYSDLDDDGNKTETVPFDLARYARIQNDNVDLGPYEYGGSKLQMHEIQVTANPLLSGNITGNEFLVQEGKNANISATPYNGYIFLNWSGDANGSTNPLTITVDSAKSITANFAQDLNDTDSDGLSNYAELVTHGTKVDDNDTDNDGLLDNEEIQIGTNPNISNSNIVNFLNFKASSDQDKARSAGQTTGIDMVKANPSTYGLYSSEDLNTSIANAKSEGENSVTSNPSAYNLVTKSSYDQALSDANATAEQAIADAKVLAKAEGIEEGKALGKSEGETSVTSNPSAYNLVTQDAYDQMMNDLMSASDSNATHYTEGWFYHPSRGWMWTDRLAYPYFYDATDKDWMYFQSGNDKPKFYRYKTKTWLTVE